MTLLPMKPAREGGKRAPITWEFFFFFPEEVRSRSILESTGSTGFRGGWKPRVNASLYDWADLSRSASQPRGRIKGL